MKSLYKKLLCLALALLMLVSAVPAAAAPAAGARYDYPDVKFPVCEQTDLGDVYGIRYANPRSYHEMTIDPIFRDKPTTVLMSGCLYCSSDYVDLEAWGGGGFYRYYPSTFTIPPSINTVEDNLVGRGKEVTLIFEGDAPSFGSNAFAGDATFLIQYPAQTSECPASGWENVVGQNFGGETVSWSEYEREHDYLSDSTCVYCGVTCQHEMRSPGSSGTCIHCGLKCTHDMVSQGSYAECTNCGYTCDHQYTTDLSAYDKALAPGSECENPGTLIYTCDKCGHTYSEDTDFISHNYQKGRCTLCGGPCPHDYARGVWVSQPTCTKDGQKSYTCQICSYVKYARFPATGHSYHMGYCTVCDAICPHELGEPVWTSPATCTEYGNGYAICSVCEQTVSINADPIGHSYQDGSCTVCGEACTHSFARGVWVTQPTCTEDGQKSYTCQTCGYVKYARFPATGHSFDDGIWVSTPACLAAADKDYTCQTCGYVERVTIPATGHSIVNGKCEYCNSPCEHQYSYKNNLGICTLCDAVCEHLREDPNNASPISTIVCKLEDGSKCGEEGTLIRTCTICNYTYIESFLVLPHIFQDDVCQFCGATKNTDYDYIVLEDGTCKITKCHRQDSNLTVPETVNGHTVTEIGNDAFFWGNNSTVTLPPTVREIYRYAFDSSALQNLILTGDAPVINRDAFKDMTVTIYYPAGNETYTQELFDSIPNTVWEPYCLDHSFVDSKCEYCGEVCEHSFVDGVCSGCGFQAPDHDYVDGICIDCGRPLPEDVQPCATHNFNRCVCTVCGTLCPSFDLHLEGGDHKCSVCGYWDWSYTVFDECLHVNRFGTWITKPTCTTDGQVRLDCNYCTDAQTVTVPAHGHEFVDGICIYCDLPDSASCEHSYDNGVVVRESTCAVKGEKLYTCTLCGDTKSEALKLANHYYIDKLCVNCARPAREDMDCGSYHNFRDCNCMVCGYTCTDHVYDNDTCQICGFSKNISSGDECSHQSYTGSWITKATCTTNGQVQYTCLGCDHSYTENVPAPGHELVDGVCIYCDAEVGCVHSYENGVCTLCGEACEHSFVDGVCQHCGEADPDYVAPVIPGDVDGNGVLNIIDIARLYGNVKGSAQLEDTAAADFNGDGKINIIDVAQAYAQVKG